MLANLFTVKNVLKVAGGALAIAGMVIDGKKAKLEKAELLNEAAEKATAMVLEKLSKNQ